MLGFQRRTRGRNLRPSERLPHPTFNGDPNMSTIAGQQVDDLGVKQALTVFARAHLDRPGLVLELNREILSALRPYAGDALPTAEVTESELARSALDVLADDARYAPEIRALLVGRASERFAVVETTALVTAVLVVLQTHVRFERQPNGSWSLEIEKKPTDKTLLGKLVSKLLAFLR
jgi:hypothetical protein